MSPAQHFPEHFGAFKLYGPIPDTTMDGWTLSWHGEWLPGSYQNRDALFLIIGMFLTEPKRGPIDKLMELLQEKVNRAVPSRNITAEEILREYSLTT